MYCQKVLLLYLIFNKKKSNRKYTCGLYYILEYLHFNTLNRILIIRIKTQINK